jgi:hypothetical protein
MAPGHLSYYQDTSPVMADNARYTIREVLTDYRSAAVVPGDLSDSGRADAERR